MSPVSQKSTVSLSYLFSHVFWQLVIYMIGYFAFLGIQKGITHICAMPRFVPVRTHCGRFEALFGCVSVEICSQFLLNIF